MTGKVRAKGEDDEVDDGRCPQLDCDEAMRFNQLHLDRRRGSVDRSR